MQKENKIPHHIAIIMDGNRRWAKENGVPRIEGHRAGALSLEKVLEQAGKRGVKIVTAYAFSSENRGRDPKEVKDLMFLLGYYIKKKRSKLNKLGASLKIIGDVSYFPKELQDELNKAVNMLKDNDKLHLNIALNYGGRDEIVRAARLMAESGIKPEDFSAAQLENFLYTQGQPDPDLVIRAGQVVRLSNFLPWQSTYSELYFSDKLWPDFRGKELDKAIDEFSERKRRFGK